jgi:hypothetical protein
VNGTNEQERIHGHLTAEGARGGERLGGGGTVEREPAGRRGRRRRRWRGGIRLCGSEEIRGWERGACGTGAGMRAIAGRDDAGGKNRGRI